MKDVKREVSARQLGTVEVEKSPTAIQELQSCPYGTVIACNHTYWNTKSTCLLGGQVQVPGNTIS